MFLSGPGAFNKWTVVVLLLATANAPHPDAACTVKLVAVAVAVPPDVGVTVSQEATGLVTVSTVNGVPPVAAEVMPTVLAGPGV